MRRRLLTASGGALILAILASAPPARAYETIVGGLAGACSAAAKAGRADLQSIGICTQALGEVLNAHDRAGTFVNRGAMRLMNRDFEQAHGDFQSALKIKPDMGEAMIGEGVYLINMERWPEAETSITRGLKAGTEEAEKGYYFRGIARWAQEDFKGAWLDFRKASELKPSWDLPKRQLTHFQVHPAS